MTWVEVYSRCMDGEHFRGEVCPRDGSSNVISDELAHLASEMRAKGAPISVQGLIDRGFAGDLSQLMVAEFAEAGDATDWLRPNG